VNFSQYFREDSAQAKKSYEDKFGAKGAKSAKAAKYVDDEEAALDAESKIAEAKDSAAGVVRARPVAGAKVCCVGCFQISSFDFFSTLQGAKDIAWSKESDYN
jgi:hypothetical protein